MVALAKFYGVQGLGLRQFVQVIRLARAQGLVTLTVQFARPLHTPKTFITITCINSAWLYL